MLIRVELFFQLRLIGEILTPCLQNKRQLSDSLITTPHLCIGFRFILELNLELKCYLLSTVLHGLLHSTMTRFKKLASQS